MGGAQVQCSTMDILAELVGSAGRARALRLFLFSADLTLTVEETARRARLGKPEALRELRFFERIGLLKRVKRATRVASWTVESTHEAFQPLLALATSTTLRHHEILDKLRPVGKLSAVVLAGGFINEPRSRADLLVVADRLDEKKLLIALKQIEVEVGREIRYVAFETPEFKYRRTIYDKLIRDILDFPHQVLLDRIGVHV